MSQPEPFEMLVLGSGEGGKFLAWHMAKSGHRTALVERKLIGGSCPNTNCLPSKNEIWSAKVADLVHHADRFGMVTGSTATNMKKVLARKRDMVDGLIAMHLDNYKASGAELIMGTGRFIAPKTIEVSLNDGGTRVLTGDRVALNLGTHATIPDIPGLAAAKPLTNIEALELDRLPDHLVVIGGGYVGLELAQAYRRFGSRVSIIEAGPQLAGREDSDVATAILEMLRDERIVVHLEAKVLGVQGRSGETVSLQTRTPSGDQTIEGSPQFPHVSFDDFRIIRDNLAGGDRTPRNRLVPYCMFTDPPLARVGLSEREAQRQGIAVRVAKLPIVAVLRSRTISETRGFLKALVEADGNRILGFTMLGAEAGEVMAVVQTAMLASMPYTGLRDAIIAHPTMAEGLGALFSNIPAR